MQNGQGIVQFMVSIAVGFALFSATLGIMLVQAGQASTTAQEAAENESLGLNEDARNLLIIVPTIIGFAAILVTFVIIRKVTGVNLV